MSVSGHENLQVYQLAVRLSEELEMAARAAPRGRSDIREQLRSASLSIPLNIAEGAGEFRPAEKARFYGYARRSANECMSVLDVLRALHGRSDLYRPVQDDLRKAASMLTALIVVHERRAGHV